MRKILGCFLVITMILILSGCGGNNEPDPEPIEYHLGDTIALKDFKITFISYSIRESVKNTSKYSKLVFLEVEVENITKKDAKFPIGTYDVYNTKDLKLDKISSADYSTSIHLGTIRSNGKTMGHIIFPLNDYGTYTLIFKDKTHSELMNFTVYEE